MQFIELLGFIGFIGSIESRCDEVLQLNDTRFKDKGSRL